MFIRVEASSGVPITAQIADQIRRHCASGTLCAGDRMPSVRQLAKELAVNQNTVLRVYERLTSEGLLERRQGDGTFVSDSLPRGQLRAQRELLRQETERLARRAIDLGVDADDLKSLLDDAFSKLQRKGSPASNGGQRDE